MTDAVMAVEIVSDALFTCVYRWAHGKPMKASEVTEAIHQHREPTTRYGALASRLGQLQAMTYEALCEAGFLDTDHNREIMARRLVVSELIGEAELNDWLRDIERVRRLFSDEQKPERKTRLPLSWGSHGYDVQQDFIIKNYLPSKSLCAIYGPSGSYKSFLAISWACHIAAGKTWSSNAVARGSVLYVVGEGGVGVPRRVKAWETVNGTLPKSICLVNRPVFPVRQSEVQEVLSAAKQVERETGMPVRLVVIDTLARCFGGNDENDARDMGAFIEGCDTIKQKTGATVLVVHHSGKDEAKGARGSSSLRAALDAEFHVKREGEARALILSCTKMKDAEEPGRHAYDLRQVDLYTDEDGDNVASLVVHDTPREAKDIYPELVGAPKLSNNHMAVWQAIRSRTSKGEACTRAVIRDDLKAAGMDTSKHFSRWLNKLIELSMVIQDGEKLSIRSLREVGE